MDNFELKATLEAEGNGSSAEDSVFSFQSICFSVPGKAKADPEKLILEDVSAEVRSGQVLAIMGPSGAGKTTLINVLTMNAFGGTSTGSVTLDGKPIDMTSFFKNCFVVTQLDNHWPFLTCRETMLYAAELYLGTNAAAAGSVVDNLMKKMGLESCADTKVGNQFLPGMSGGQKRRLSIALALIKQPKLIFLDEPTSGLDAAAAANIMVFIKELAKEERLIVVATIHQPSSKVYAGFDQVMILSGGKEAFCGDARETIGYFEGLGYPMSALTNPAEFFLDLVNADFVDQAEVDKILDQWASKKGMKGSASEPAAVVATAAGAGAADRASTTSSSSSEAGTWHEIKVMLRRHALLVVRDPVLYIGRAFIFLFSNLYFTAVYAQARNRNQDQVLNRMWLGIWYIGVPANMGVVAVYALNEEYKSVAREIKNGMVTPFSYVLAKSVLQVPIMFIWAVFALGQAYAIMDYYVANFGLMMVIFACYIYAWEAMAELLSVAFENPLLGMMQFMGLWFSAFLYGGFLIPGEDIYWPLKIFFYILPIKYTVRSMNYVDNIDAKFDGCAKYDDDEQFCFGQQGDEVLKNVGSIYPLITDENTLSTDIGIVLAIAAFFKLQYIVILVVKSRAASTLGAPLQKSKQVLDKVHTEA